MQKRKAVKGGMGECESRVESAVSEAVAFGNPSRLSPIPPPWLEFAAALWRRVMLAGCSETNAIGRRAGVASRTQRFANESGLRLAALHELDNRCAV